MRYFDFHVHAALKAQFQDVDKRSTPWDVYKVGLSIIDWQSSLTQLNKGGVKLTGIALHVPEPHMNSELMRVLNGNGIFQRIFKILLASVLKMIKALLSNARLTELANEDVNSFEILKQELDNLETNRLKPGSNDEFIFITRRNDYDASKEKTIYAFIVVEGLHCFKGADRMDTPQGITQIKANITELCTKKHLRVLAVNPAHLQYNTVCNHSFGIKMFDDKKFYPTGDGIDSPGIFWEVVEMLYNRNILVDIKHMSAKTRDQFYTGRRQRNYDLPIICTHAGITGIPRSRAGYFVYERPKNRGEVTEVSYCKPLGHVERTSFNISSINLYDEDIIEILESGGLIGISLDRRIIGFTEYFEDTDVLDLEYLSPSEFSFLFPVKPGRDWEADEVLDPATHTIEDKQNYIRLDARYFLNQVFHILKVAKSKSDGLLNVALNSICIGSDFDGMIDSLFCCRTAVDFPSFYHTLEEEISSAAAEAGIPGQWTDGLLEKIFIENGTAFALERIDVIDAN